MPHVERVLEDWEADVYAGLRTVAVEVQPCRCMLYASPGLVADILGGTECVHTIPQVTVLRFTASLSVESFEQSRSVA